MSQTRTCERCHGEQFELRTASGEQIIWTHASGRQDTWFCPSCDWGGGEENA